jgi:hypothetical protein
VGRPSQGYRPGAFRQPAPQKSSPRLAPAAPPLNHRDPSTEKLYDNPEKATSFCNN